MKFSVWVSAVCFFLTLARGQNILAIQEGFGHPVVSSEYNADHGLTHMRLDYVSRVTSPDGGSAWAAAVPDANQWVIVGFGSRNIRIVAFCTQGRGDFDQWVTSYNLSFTINGVDWIPFKSTPYAGNTDRNTQVCYDLLPFYQIKAIKVVPLAWNNWVAMRLDAYIQLIN